jgi:hypothetical protein
MVSPKNRFTYVIRIKKEGKKTMKKKYFNRTENINLVFLHVDHRFLVLEPKPLDTFIVPHDKVFA